MRIGTALIEPCIVNNIMKHDRIDAMYKAVFRVDMRNVAARNWKKGKKEGEVTFNLSFYESPLRYH